MKALDKISIVQWSLIVLFVGVLLFFLYKAQSPSHLMESDLEAVLLNEVVTYEQQVKPILDKRCVVCHGCYDAPCQLKLSSIEGIQRGANKERIYEPKRISAMQPTRLFVDAKTTQQWRSRQFFPVLSESTNDEVTEVAETEIVVSKTAEENLKNSVLYHLLRLKKQHPQPERGQLPESVTLGLDRKGSCPTIDEVDQFSQEHPRWGMPYAMPNLSDSEYQTLVSWLSQGSPISPTSAISTTALSSTVPDQVEKWEGFLNQPAKKNQLVNRYLYEHLFHAHIHFKDSPDREFYRLVRSATPHGEAIDEISTLKPYDYPGSAPFYYRLLRYTPSIVVKSHIVYEFSNKRMQRYRALFLTPDYRVDKLPSYETKMASNPFKTFVDLPAKSRYRFLLDDAHFFIEGFIKGPVCRGQIALDVIEDQFWVLFFDPDQPVITNDEAFIKEMADQLQVPAEGGSNLKLFTIWTDYWKGLRRYMEKKQAWFKTIGAHNVKHAMNFIWDGDGHNPNAALTVFRHFDSGSVAYGLVGDKPETAWVIDYPLFERIHYLLVAGFDVYGNIGHRLSTRIYMDFLRMEGEDYFLAFLPVDKRKKIRDSWYVGQRSAIAELFSTPQDWLKTEVVSGYQTNFPQNELYESIKDRLGSVLQKAEERNPCGKLDCSGEASSFITNAKNRAARSMQKIAQLRGKSLHSFPDVSFVRITMENPEDDFAYTLIRNKAYKKISSFLADERDRDSADIEKDSMSAVNWLEGAYPNFFFSVALSDIEKFSDRCSNINSADDYSKFVDQYGIRRTNPDFWAMADWFQDEALRNKRISSGLFDLNRYTNH